jgi:bifunctional DNase/RNase
MVEMQVIGLALEKNTKAPILVLRDVEQKRMLPIWIGSAEAIAISLALNGISTPRPLTHDLLISSIYALGAEIDCVEIVSLRDGAYFADLLLKKDGGTIIRLDSRPSDAAALALRAKKIIRVHSEILAEAGSQRLQIVDSGMAQLYGPHETPDLLAALFSLADSPIMEESPFKQEQAKVKRSPQITITLSPLLKPAESEAPPAVRMGNKVSVAKQEDKSLEELLRHLDPETKYRM